MAIKLGLTDIADAKLGTTQVDKIYLGSTEVWSNAPAPTIKALKFSSTGAQTLGVNTSNLGSMQPSFEYSTDNGETWTAWNPTRTGTVVTIQFGNGVDLLLRGMNDVLTADGSNYTNFVFSMASPVACTGNIMHLFDYTQDLTEFPSPSSSHGIRNLFYNCTVLTNAPDLPATTLTPHCYRQTFNGCINLTSAPSLPATTLTSNCYAAMFFGCTSLTTSPVLPATTLTSNCYDNMFRDTAIVSAPTLPATELNEYCYSNMFRGCTSLVNAPSLPATTLTSNCYSGMFFGCTSLTTSPVLPATTLTSNCYAAMFQNCTALTQIPSLSHVTTATRYGSFQGMFYGCTSVKMSESQDAEYTNAYTLGVTPSSYIANSMFTNTGGTFTGTPTAQTYYTANTIVS